MEEAADANGGELPEPAKGAEPKEEPPPASGTAKGKMSLMNSFRTGELEKACFSRRCSSFFSQKIL